MTRASRVYLDYNASAPLLPECRAAMLDALSLIGNASSVHEEGRQARREIEAARAAVAGMIDARPQDIVFTSGGTEANNMAILGARVASIVHSAVEHDAVRAPALLSGRPVRVVPVDGEGRLDLDALEAALADAPKPALLSLMMANNETGVVEPLEAAAALARSAGALIHTDAIQIPGRLPLDVRALDIDMLSLSAHKFGGPKGVGALWVRPGLGLDSLIAGGGQELGRRSGTENIAAIAGFGAAAARVPDLLNDRARLRMLRDRIEAELRALCPELLIAGATAGRLPNVTAISMPGLSAETQVMRFDLMGIALSAGSACSSGKVKKSHVLDAMGIEAKTASEVVRVSLGHGTTEEEVARFIDSWRRIYADVRCRIDAA